MKTKLLIALGLLCTIFAVDSMAQEPIRISTNEVDLILKVNGQGTLTQNYLGRKLSHARDMQHLPSGKEAYIGDGMNDQFEPAVKILHNDGNPSLLLKYVSHSTKEIDPNVQETEIVLADDKYPVTVKLFYTAYKKENVIKTHTQISHKEKKPVKLTRYASSMLHFNKSSYNLTSFSGDWASEVHMNDVPLEYGQRILDSKLGSRANMYCSPMFQLSLDGTATEESGEVLVGTIGWTGNFQFLFDVDQSNALRIVSGINPYSSEYELKPNEVFQTPDFYFTYSFDGKGKASRNLHSWARNYQLKDGDKTRMTLLNNWEATYFTFDEEKLISLMDEAVKLGVDMFLLDDGWFGNKYPRSSDHQGLGDWQETADKLPGGVGRLTEAAKEKGIKFGLWIEPEMVNPKSELYEKHKDWVIHLPNREEYYYRNQMVLDLSNPKVQDYVFGIVDGLMTKYPEIAFFKWDCNSAISNIYSTFLKENQSHLYINHVRGFYNILERVKAKYPNLPMMLCSGGGGRSDFEALKYFTEFWPSDNTSPVDRLYIQWGFSQIFPSKAMCAHVTTWDKNTSIKFRTDVAMMCKLGFDIKLDDMGKEDAEFCREAVKNFNRLKPVILDGDLYRLVSPYDGNHTSSMYVDEKQDKALLFAFDIYPHYGDKSFPVKLRGLDADKMYSVKEINLMPGKKSSLGSNGKVYSGEYLMNIGINVFSKQKVNSRVVEIIAE